MSMVTIKNLSRVYHIGTQTLYALRDLYLTIKEGEYIAIMGPSGSGKSTLLNILGCLDKPTSGTYELAGEDVSKLDDTQLSRIRGMRIGFIFQSYNLIQQLNVLENIEVPMYYQGYSEQQSRTRARELAELVGLDQRISHRPTELSGGQQQRVAIARALANEPLILLADEPTGNLDTESGADILTILDKLHQSGRTIIVVTHDERVAAQAQRIIRLLDGKIEHQQWKKERRKFRWPFW